MDGYFHWPAIILNPSSFFQFSFLEYASISYFWSINTLFLTENFNSAILRVLLLEHLVQSNIACLSQWPNSFFPLSFRKSCLGFVFGFRAPFINVSSVIFDLVKFVFKYTVAHSMKEFISKYSFNFVILLNINMVWIFDMGLIFTSNQVVGCHDNWVENYFSKNSSLSRVFTFLLFSWK